jgi:hypothetical protein
MKRLLVLLLSSSCMASAWADTSATATVSNFKATLYDLDPLDGVTPSISFNLGPEYNARVGYSFYGSQRGEPAVPLPQATATAASKFGPVDVSGASESALAGAEVSGDGTLGGTVLHAWGRSTSSTEFERYYYADARILRDTSDTYSARAFTISSHTLVVFSADVSLSASVSYGTIPQGQTGGEYAVAFSQLLVFEQGVGYNPGPQDSVEELIASEATSGQGFGNHKQAITSAQFRNVTAQALTHLLHHAGDSSSRSTTCERDFGVVSRRPRSVY